MRITPKINLITYFILTLFCVPTFVFAQKINTQHTDLKNALDQLNTQSAKAEFNSGRIVLNDDDMDKTIHDYFKSKLIEIQKTTDDLKLLHNNTSSMGYHYHYLQTYKNIPIYGATLDITLAPGGTILSSFNNLINSTTFEEVNFAADISKGEPIFIYTNQTIVPAYKRYLGYDELISDANGNLIRQKDTRLYYMNDDTTVTGKVFLPDPLTSQSVIYGQNGTYQHFNDSDYALLNDQRISVNFTATFKNDTFYLENQYTKIVDIGFPFTNPVKSAQPVFNYTRKQDGFKDVMAFYHIYSTQLYYQSLGFNNLKNYQIKIDAQEASIGDNSYFNPSDTTLNFGTGGIPDAEDGDVSSHEYTHALSWFINATPNMSNERRAVEEGMCDVIAAIKSKKYTSFNWRKLYNFDGANPIASGISGFWGGRMGDSEKTYDDYTGSNYYVDCVIWSSIMLDITEQIGMDETAKLMLTSIYSMPYNITMPQAAILFLQADSILNAKKYTWKINPIFNARKLGNFATGINDIRVQQNFKLFNTLDFANGSGDAIIEVTSPSNITIYNLQGQKVLEQKQIAHQISISPSSFLSGFYFIIIQNEKGTSTAKINKF